MKKARIGNQTNWTVVIFGKLQFKQFLTGHGSDRFLALPD